MDYILQEGLGESASLSGQLSRPGSHNSFGDVDNMGMTDIKPPGLCNGVGPIEDFHNSGPLALLECRVTIKQRLIPF